MMYTYTKHIFVAYNVGKEMRIRSRLLRASNMELVTRPLQDSLKFYNKWKTVFLLFQNIDELYM